MVPSRVDLGAGGARGQARDCAHVIVRAIRQHHFIGQQSQRGVAGDAAAVVGMDYAAMHDRAGGDDDAAVLDDILRDLRGEQRSGAIFTR